LWKALSELKGNHLQILHSVNVAASMPGITSGAVAHAERKVLLKFVFGQALSLSMAGLFKKDGGTVQLRRCD
jgi:hypothetical protein